MRTLVSGADIGLLVLLCGCFVSAIRRAAAWQTDNPHPSRHQLRNLCMGLAAPGARTVNARARMSPAEKKLMADLKQELAAQAKGPKGPAPQPQAQAVQLRPHMHRRLKDRLAALQRAGSASGYDIVDVPADGSCLFSALAHQLSLLTAQLARAAPMQRYTAGQLRALAVQQLLCRYLTEEEQSRFFESEREDVLTYCQRMMTPTQWGGHNELQELANYFNVNIQVHFGGHHDCSYVVRARQLKDQSLASAPMLHVAFVNAGGDESAHAVLNHYLSVVPKVFPKPRR